MLKTITPIVRFDIFKRDDFTCRYCGKRSPIVILEIDHIVPKSKGGGDDEMNLVTACFECNRGKSNKSLSESLTGSDPHDKAIELQEKERQLLEYESVRWKREERMAKDLQYMKTRWDLQENFWEILWDYLGTGFSRFQIEDALRAANRKRLKGVSFIKYTRGVLRIMRGKNGI